MLYFIIFLDLKNILLDIFIEVSNLVIIILNFAYCFLKFRSIKKIESWLSVKFVKIWSFFFLLTSPKLCDIYTKVSNNTLCNSFKVSNRTFSKFSSLIISKEKFYFSILTKHNYSFLYVNILSFSLKLKNIFLGVFIAVSYLVNII